MGLARPQRSAAARRSCYLAQRARIQAPETEQLGVHLFRPGLTKRTPFLSAMRIFVLVKTMRYLS